MSSAYIIIFLRVSYKAFFKRIHISYLNFLKTDVVAISIQLIITDSLTATGNEELWSLHFIISKRKFLKNCFFDNLCLVTALVGWNNQPHDLMLFAKYFFISCLCNLDEAFVFPILGTAFLIFLYFQFACRMARIHE